MGEIVPVGMRGAWLGNRGIIHRETEIVRSHASNLWITCELEYKGWRLPQWAPGHLTVLFFQDEAVSLAAGHRPCALCRRSAYNDYRDAWASAVRAPRPLAKEIDRQLHAERLYPRTRRRRLHEAEWRSLPPGTFVRPGTETLLVLDDTLVPWTVCGYGPARPRPSRGSTLVVTPPSTTAAIREGYAPQIDRSAFCALALVEGL